MTNRYYWEAIGQPSKFIEGIYNLKCKYYYIQDLKKREF